jgi:hypothetical protein
VLLSASVILVSLFKPLYSYAVVWMRLVTAEVIGSMLVTVLLVAIVLPRLSRLMVSVTDSGLAIVVVLRRSL